MHISEGVLSGTVLLSGGAIAAVGTFIGLKKIDLDHIANVGILSATFFIASLIHVNIGPSSVHLIMNGMIGLLLGWAAIPAILVALILQSIFFQFGGITVLGVNTIIMAAPAVLGYHLFGPLVFRSKTITIAAAFTCGAMAVFLSSLLMAAALLFTEESFREISVLVVTAHLPVMVIEGIISVFCISFLKKVRPEIFPSYNPAIPISSSVH
jgi:cobalt/nickel transport system permease protein